MSEQYIVGRIELSPLQCSQGGVPFNKEHLDYQNKRIKELEAEIERLRAELQEIIEYVDSGGSQVITCKRIAVAALGGDDE